MTGIVKEFEKGKFDQRVTVKSEDEVGQCEIKPEKMEILKTYGF